MFDVDVFFWGYQKSEVNFRVNVRFSVVSLDTSRQRDMGRTSMSSVMLYGKSSIVFLSMNGNKAANNIRRDFPWISSFPFLLWTKKTKLLTASIDGRVDNPEVRDELIEGVIELLVIEVRIEAESFAVQFSWSGDISIAVRSRQVEVLLLLGMLGAIWGKLANLGYKPYHPVGEAWYISEYGKKTSRKPTIAVRQVCSCGNWDNSTADLGRDK